MSAASTKVPFSITTLDDFVKAGAYIVTHLQDSKLLGSALGTGQTPPDSCKLVVLRHTTTQKARDLSILVDILHKNADTTLDTKTEPGLILLAPFGGAGARFIGSSHLHAQATGLYACTPQEEFPAHDRTLEQYLNLYTPILQKFQRGWHEQVEPFPQGDPYVSTGPPEEDKDVYTLFIRKDARMYKEVDFIQHGLSYFNLEKETIVGHEWGNKWFIRGDPYVWVTSTHRTRFLAIFNLKLEASVSPIEEEDESTRI